VAAVWCVCQSTINLRMIAVSPYAQTYQSPTDPSILVFHADVNGWNRFHKAFKQHLSTMANVPLSTISRKPFTAIVKELYPHLHKEEEVMQRITITTSSPLDLLVVQHTASGAVGPVE